MARKKLKPIEQEEGCEGAGSPPAPLDPSALPSPATTTELVPVDSERELNPIDPNTYIQNGFRDALYRSQNVRGRMWELVPKAHRAIDAILTDPITEKSMPTQFAAARFVIETNLVKFPDISHKTVEINDNRIPESAQTFKPVTRQEVIEATLVAMEAEGHKGEDEREHDTDDGTKST